MGVEPYQFVIRAQLRAGSAAGAAHLLALQAVARVEQKLLEESALDPALVHTYQFYEGAGCIECGGTGFKGRTAICELLDLSDRIREMILARRPNSDVKKAAHEEGMRFLANPPWRSPARADDAARD